MDGTGCEAFPDTLRDLRLWLFHLRITHARTMTNLPRRAHRRAARRLTALVAATGLLLVACSSDGDSPPETAGTEAAEVETTVPEVDETLADDPVPTAAATQPAPAATPDDPPPQFRIATFNAGLAEGFVPLAAERLPLVAEAVADLDADLVFLQEVWTPEAVAELRNASSTTFTESVFPEPIPDSELGDPACTIDELADLEECIALNCADASPDDLVGCVLTNCASQYGGLCEECQTCIAANVGKTVDEAIANCTTSSSVYAYDGSVGIGLLSKSVILDSDVLVLESSLNRRAVLHALVDTEALRAGACLRHPPVGGLLRHPVPGRRDVGRRTG